MAGAGRCTVCWAPEAWRWHRGNSVCDRCHDLLLRMVAYVMTGMMPEALKAEYREIIARRRAEG